MNAKKPRQQMNRPDGDLSISITREPLGDEPPTDRDAPRDWRQLGRRILGEAQRRTMRDMRRHNGCTPRYWGNLRNPGGLA